MQREPNCPLTQAQPKGEPPTAAAAVAAAALAEVEAALAAAATVAVLTTAALVVAAGAASLAASSICKMWAGCHLGLCRKIENVEELCFESLSAPL